MTFSGTALRLANDASISGLTVGKGGGAVATNTAVGASALAANTSGDINTAFGFEALKANTTGAENVAVGYRALDVNTTGTNNIAMGRNALGANTSGSSNVGVGDSALVGNTTANGNCAFGSDALGSNSTGASNVAVGRSALESNTTASNNTVVGYQAGYSQTTSPDNVFMGNKAGYSTSTGGGSNTFIGQQAGYSHTTGQNNQFFGGGAGYYISTGSKNTIIGAYSGNQGGLDIRTATNYVVLSDGDGNVAFSWKQGTGSGSFFSINGVDSGGQLNTTPTINTFSADFTDGFRWNSTGNSYWNRAGNGSVLIFRNNGSNAGNISNSGTTTSYNGTSDYRLKKNIQSMTGGLAKLMQLRPVTFDWLYDDRADNGFIAHELQEVLPNAVVGEKDALDKDGNILAQGIDPRNIVATLTSALQELNAKFDAYVASHP
jgi:hypothetical protein